MPNHVHGIIEIRYQRLTTRLAPLLEEKSLPRNPAGSFGVVIRSFKAAVTNRTHTELGLEGEVWQRNYYETILRNAQALLDARTYIQQNVQNWEWDQTNPDRHVRQLP